MSNVVAGAPGAALPPAAAQAGEWRRSTDGCAVQLCNCRKLLCTVVLCSRRHMRHTAILLQGHLLVPLSPWLWRPLRRPTLGWAPTRSQSSCSEETCCSPVGMACRSFCFVQLEVSQLALLNTACTGIVLLAYLLAAGCTCICSAAHLVAGRHHSAEPFAGLGTDSQPIEIEEDLLVAGRPAMLLVVVAC